jgi:hypothetical protein
VGVFLPLQISVECRPTSIDCRAEVLTSRWETRCDTSRLEHLGHDLLSLNRICNELVASCTPLGNIAKSTDARRLKRRILTQYNCHFVTRCRRIFDRVDLIRPPRQCPWFEKEQGKQPSKQDSVADVQRQSSYGEAKLCSRGC